MKKRLVALLAGLLTVLSMGFGLAQFSDVPAGHWAKEAVEALAAKGIVVGFPDGTFRGNEPITRYQAALIIYRLLQQIEEELKAKGTSPTMEAMSPEDLEALKNAIQELAAELAALGVRVSALEDSAATKDDIARLEALIEELRAQPMPEVEPGMDQAALQDLLDRVEAASIAADTALAQAQQLAEQLEALAQDVEGVKGDLAALATQVEANAQAIQALNELAVLLNQDVLSLQDRVTALEKALAERGEGPAINLDELASKEDVAAVQEFAAALRSDLVSLSEKVSKLESQVADLSKVQYSIKGSLTATYGFVTLAGTDFDIDRLFATPFSTGVFGPTGQVASNVRLEDVASRQLTGGSLTLDFGVKNNAPAATGVAVSEATVQILASAIASGAPTPNLRLNTATLKGTVDGQPFSVVYHWRASSFRFNDYLFVNRSDPAGREHRQGVVATFQGTKLPLSPEVTVVLGTSSDGDSGDIFGDRGYFGIRAAFKPLEGLTLALNYALADTEPLTATPPANPDRSALGVDGTLKLGDFSVKGLFVTSRPATGIYFRDYFDPTISNWVYYVQLDGKLGPLSLKANYHAVDPQYEYGVAGMSADHLQYYGGVTGRQNPAPYPPNEEGLGVELGLPLGPVELGGYLNSYGAYPYNPGTITTEAGASAKVALFSGFSLRAAYDAAWTGASYVDLDTQTSARITGTLSHDGAAKDALVKDLNLTLQGTYNLPSASTPTPYFGLAVYGDYKLALGPLSLDKILFRYHEPNFNTQGDETLKGGLQASLKLDGLPFKPSLTGEVAARQTRQTVGPSPVEELKWSVGLSLGEFLFPGSKLEARYGEYRASNVASIRVGAVNRAFDPSDDRLYSNNGTNSGSVSGSVAGFNVTWSYYDFRADYGEYITSLGDHARTFRVTYTTRF
ncbi:Outer membrane protein alpha precursor [Thermus aquaticus]|uniref:Outer membrane protein alpha n=1 Tax=Thermus aquaticus TaxID=271 RepID=A0A0M9AEW8_THEAQ|nr:S-layer homology domain-containing protein [Thermus aquaticus]KOX89455.1 Outer membrane protein alpha precursor [Thermus aquaticus]